MRCGVARRTEKPFSLRWRTALAVSSRTIRGDPHERDGEPFDNGRRERLTATLDPDLTMSQRTMNDSSAPMSAAQPKLVVSRKRTSGRWGPSTIMGGNLPFIRPGLNGEVVPIAVLRRL